MFDMAVVNFDEKPTLVIPLHKKLLDELKLKNWINMPEPVSSCFWLGSKNMIKIKLHDEENILWEKWAFSLRDVAFKIIYVDLRFNIGFDILLSRILTTFNSFTGVLIQTDHVIAPSPRIVELMHKNLNVVKV